jgi:hypothetical protein
VQGLGDAGWPRSGRGDGHEALVDVGLALQCGDGLGQRRVGDAQLLRVGALADAPARMSDRDPGLLGQDPHQELSVGRGLLGRADHEVAQVVVEAAQWIGPRPALARYGDRAARCREHCELHLEIIMSAAFGDGVADVMPADVDEKGAVGAAAPQCGDRRHGQVEDVALIICLGHHHGQDEQRAHSGDLVPSCRAGGRIWEDGYLYPREAVRAGSATGPW